MLYARRIEFYARCLQQAHQLGAEPGQEHPWSLRYQRKAVRVYTEDLPSAYLKQLACSFLGCSEALEDSSECVVDASEDLRIVDAYFTNGAQAIGEELGIVPEAQWHDVSGQSPTTPAVVRFDILARFASGSGVRRLAEAGSSVVHRLSAEDLDSDILSAEQRRLLADIGQGFKMLDIATQRGFSRSSLYREIGRICDLLGVENKQQAFVAASRRGLLP